MLHNFSLFLPPPAIFVTLLPAPSSPTSRTPPAPFSPCLLPPCPSPQEQDQRSTPGFRSFMGKRRETCQVKMVRENKREETTEIKVVPGITHDTTDKRKTESKL